MAENQPGVVDLVDAGVPADQGLSSLGLLMQLGLFGRPEPAPVGS